MILDKQVCVSLSGNNIEYYKNLGYDIPLQPSGGVRKDRMSVKRGTKILVNIEDLQEGSHTIVNVKCDYCNKIFTRQYYLVVKGRKNNLKDACGNPECRCKKSGEVRQKDFSEVVKAFNDRGYVLLTTANEIDFLNTYPLRYLCPAHGEHTITWNNFIQGAGCPDCAIEKNKIQLKKHAWERIQKAFEDSEYKLLSSFDEYTSSTDNCLRCWCDKHGEFITSWANFQRSLGCPTCNISSGERRIMHYLNDNNIKHERPKIFDDLLGVGGGKLSYDFFLPMYNLLIEYQGAQHAEPGHFSMSLKDNEENFIKQQEHDRRKREYANKNGYNLLEIWYYDFNNINMILENELMKNTI